jgi:hypothetical protein
MFGQGESLAGGIDHPLMAHVAAAGVLDLD